MDENRAVGAFGSWRRLRRFPAPSLALTQTCFPWKFCEQKPRPRALTHPHCGDVSPGLGPLTHPLTCLAGSLSTLGDSGHIKARRNPGPQLTDSALVQREIL